MDWTGSLVKDRRPYITFGEQFKHGVSQGVRHNWFWETALDLNGRSARVSALEEEDPRNTEIISPTQIAEEFPGIRKPILSPSRRSYAKYVQERDLLEQKLNSAFVGRNSEDYSQIASGFLGGLVGGLTDPINLAMGFGVYTLPVSAVRQSIIAARLAQKTAMSRGVLAATSAADQVVANALYSAGQMATRGNLLDRHYGWDEFGLEVTVGAGIGALGGFALPKRFHPRLTQKDETFIQAWSAYGKELADMPYGQVREFLRSEEGSIRLPDLARILKGRELPARPTIGVKKVEALEKSAVSKSYLQNFQEQVKERAAQSRGFGSGFRVTSMGVRSFGRNRFKQPKQFFSYFSGENIPLQAVSRTPMGEARVNTLYTWLPKGKAQKGPRKMRLFSSPAEAAVDGFKWTKEYDKPQHVIQVDTSPIAFLSADARFNNNASYLETPAKSLKRYSRNIEKNSRFDGLWLPPKQNSNTHKAIIYEKSINKIKSFSDTFATYNFPDSKITGTDVSKFLDIMEGKDMDSNPPSIKTYVQHFFEGSDTANKENIFEKYVKRDNPELLFKVKSPTIIDNIPFKHKGRVYGIAYYKAPELWEGVPNSGRQALARIKEKFIKAAQAPDTFFRGRNTIDEMVQRVGKANVDAGGGLPGVTRLRDLLVEEGFEFTPSFDVDRNSNIWLINNQGVLPPTQGPSTIKSSILAGEDSYLGVGLKWEKRLEEPESRILRLDKFPSYMSMEEALIAKYYTRRDKRPQLSPFNNTTRYLSDPTGKVLTPEVQQLLKSLGYDKVIYGVGDKVHTKDLAGTAMLPKNGEELKGLWGRLQDALNKKEQLPEGQTRPDDELVSYYDSLYDTALKSTEGDYYSTLSRSIVSALPKGSPTIDSVAYLLRGRERAQKAMRAAELGSATYYTNFAKVKELEQDLEFAHRIVKFINSGGLKSRNIPGVTNRMGLGKFNLFYEGSELLNLFKSQHNMPYQVLGGLNVETTQKSFFSNIVSPTIAQIKESGGDRLLDDFASGKLDREIMKIQHARYKMKQDQGGIAGQAKERLAELQVSDDALAIETILRRGMSLSQRYLTETGYSRDALPDYIGRRSYNTRKILSVPREEFIADVMTYGLDMSEIDARNLRDSFSESAGQVFGTTDSISDVRERFNKNRRLKFKDAESEFAFLDKYGSATAKLGYKNLWTNYLNKIPFLGEIQSGSNIFNGFMASAQSDSSIAAVTSTFGTRPYLTLEVAHGVLDNKRLLAENAGQLTSAQGQALTAKNHRAKSASRRILDDWLAYDSGWGQGKVATATRILKSITNSALLSASGVYAAISDRFTSALQLDKLTKEKTGYVKNMGRAFTNLRENVMRTFDVVKDPRIRQEVAAKMNVVMTADTREYLSRFMGEPAGEAAWIESAAIKASFAPYLTDKNKVGQMFAVGSVMSERFKVPWDNLHPEQQNLFGTHQITPEIWELVRNLPGIRAQSGGIDFVSLQDMRVALVDKLGEHQGRKVYLMFDTFFQDIITRSVVENQVYSRAFWEWSDRNKEDLVHNLVDKSSQMYKGINIEALLSFKAGALQLVGKGQRPFMPEAQAIAPILSGMILTGAMATWLHDIATGKTPREIDEDNWLPFLGESIMRSGAVGLWADFLLGNATGSLYNWLGFFTGPTLQTAYQFAAVPYGVGQSIYEGDPEHAQRRFYSLLNRTVPVFGPTQRILLNGALLDSFGDLGKLRYYESQIGRRKQRARDWNQEYFGDAF